MTLETLYISLNQNAGWIALLVFAAPWLVWILCDVIPGKWEEPWILSLNMMLAVASLAMWAGYLAFASNVGGWEKVVKEAQVLLLCIPPYYALMSVWVARQRLPLSEIPAFRTLQGLALMCGVYLIISWLGRRIHIVFFSYMPFTSFLWLLAILLLVGYVGYRRLMGSPPSRTQD
jgi:hypothetical protein